MKWNEIKFNYIEWDSWGDGLRGNYEMIWNAIQSNCIEWNELKEWTGIK